MSLYRTLDPTTGQLVESYPTIGDDELEARLEAAARAFDDWRKRPLSERTGVLQRAAELLEQEAREHAATMALEMGKPLAEGVAEAEKCAWACRYYAEHAAAFLQPELHESDGSQAFVRYDPLGPILAIMPWNFPFWQVFRFAAPALAAGNLVLLKHAPGTPRCALALADLLARAGCPEGVFQSLFLSNEQAAEVIADPRVRGVTLTGSTGAGREVASAAGRALKPMVMELGGSDPFIVFADADLEQAVRIGVASRCLNSGQSCISAKRFLVERPILERFTEAFVAGMRGRKMGDPRRGDTDVGPLARADLRDHLARQVADSVARGARALCGGEVPEGAGFFYPPTVLTEVPADAPAAREELFGPVATLIPFASEVEAVAIANATPYGLGASLWTGDPARAERLIPDLESGSVFVNGLVKSDPRLPFGGVKDSGFGRELAREGMLEFVNQKTVWIA
ncbi:MAG: NAD-dependent succinate-semialdehyde dehydrogenase [Acidobacteria bacterium]|nr:MAG: NAD-dependent succinate-semialdehyde dehydrogenase [Acidobacteriota bacterium]